MQNSSLPILLDLTAAPSYPPKSANTQKRPATTHNNSKAHSMGSSLHTPGIRLQTSQPQQRRTYIQTTTTFYNQLPDAQKDSETFFCFTELKTAARPLKKLYTGPQHELLLKKRDSIKERYQRLYENTSPEESEIKENPDNLKELVLGAEKVMNSTYSVKYFGLKDNQLGIVSKRIPIATFDEKSYQLANQQLLLTPEKNTTATVKAQQPKQKPRSRTPNQGMRNSEPGPWRNSTISSKCEDDLKSSARAAVTNTNSNANPTTIEHLTKSVGEQIEEVAVSEKHEEDNTTPHYYEIENVSKVHSVMKNNSTPFPSGYEQPHHRSTYTEDKRHVVTQYMIPRKLQSAKKSDSGRRGKSVSNSQWEVQGYMPNKAQYYNSSIRQQESSEASSKRISDERNRMWVKVVPEDQRASNTADFERKVMSLEKTKRTLLRNVEVEKVWESKTLQSELDVPAKFRTFEVNKVLSDTSKYSYSHLLKTMYTNDRPETALVENTQKMERIISARQEKKKHSPSKSLKGITAPNNKNQKEHSGRYVIKVEYPKENKMLNQFIKIKTNVRNDEEEKL